MIPNGKFLIVLTIVQFFVIWTRVDKLWW